MALEPTKREHSSSLAGMTDSNIILLPVQLSISSHGLQWSAILYYTMPLSLDQSLHGLFATPPALSRSFLAAFFVVAISVFLAMAR
jgi:hypothetical protein